jgi:Transposase IS66 family
MERRISNIASGRFTCLAGGEPIRRQTTILYGTAPCIPSPTKNGPLVSETLLTRANKAELLLVLDFPEVPLENNRMERDLREGVVKRKISSGPRGPDGAQAWQVFLTLLATCRKQGVNFLAYRCDRLAQLHQAPPLAELVRALRFFDMRFEKFYRSVPGQFRGLSMVSIRSVALKKPMCSARVRIKFCWLACCAQTILQFFDF